MSALTSDDLGKLKAKFPNDRLGVKIQSFSKDRSKVMLVLYLQHTDVADRIEEVDPSWSYEVKSQVQCGDTFVVHGRLTIKGVSRENAGEGEDPKSAYSDALKRCAMLFGVGRYLYDSELVWVPYDDQRDRFRQWTPEEYFGAARRSAPAATPLAKQEEAKAPARTRSVAKGAAPVKPRGAIAPESEPDFDSMISAVPLNTRDGVNRKLMALYRPYLTHFPQTRFQDLLTGRYNVTETRLMTVEQCQDLIRFMEKTLAEVAEPGSKG